MIREQGDGGDSLDLAVVGLGYWGPNILRVLADLSGAHVKWVCDRDSERLQRACRRYPAVQPTTDFEAVLSDPEVDGVLLVTPVGTHYDLARMSLEADKHTFVEKPLAPSSESADELIDLAARRERILMPGHTFIYSPPVRTIKKLLDEGELGETYFVSSSRVNLGLHQQDVSVIWDLGPHDFSILLYWLQELPDKVRAVGRDSIVPGIADVAFVTLGFPSGIVANIELSWLAPSKLRRTVVVGSEKMVVYDDGSPEPIRIFDHGVVYRDPETYGEYHLSYRTGDILSPRLDTYEPLAAELGDFIDAIREASPLDAEAELARDVVHVTEAAEASMRSGGREISLSGSHPFPRQREAQERGQHPLGQSAREQGVHRTSASHPSPAVLLVDSHELSRKAMRSALEELLPGNRIIEAAGLDAALVVADRESADLDLAVIDRGFGRDDGFHIAAKLGGICPGMPRIVYAPSVNSEEFRRAREAGAQAFPVNTQSHDELLSTMAGAIGSDWVTLGSATPERVG